MDTMQGNDRLSNGGNTASGEVVDGKKLIDSHSLTVWQSANHQFQNEEKFDSEIDGKLYNKQADGRVLLPRSIVLTRSLDHGFGFTLRHFIVYPPEPSSEVECLEEEVVLFRNRQEPLDTIFVKQVRVGSPAHLAGLTTGDRILSVNEASTLNHSYQEIVAIIQTSHPSLRLIVISKENDLLQQVFSSTAHNPESNLNVKDLLFSACFQSSPWSSKSSLSSLHRMPITAPYHPAKPKPLPAPPPNARLRPIIHSPTQKRKAPTRHTSTPNSYYPNSRHESSSPHPSGGGRYTPISSSQPQVRRKIVPVTAKDSTKRPLILDRKQAVYNIQNSLPFPLQKSSSEYNASRKLALAEEQKNKEDPMVPLICQTKDNGVGPLSVKESPKREGIYEPVVNKSHMLGDSKRLEKDPDGRLYEVVQTRFINSHMPSNEPNLNRLSPLSKSKTEGNIVRRKGCSQTLSPLLIHPSKAARLEYTGTDLGISSDLSANRRMSEGLHNKENVAKSDNISQTYVTDRSTQEAIERIKKNVEKKVEFLQRPSEPLWKPQSRDSSSLKEYFASPQKFQRSNWPPQETQVPPSPGTILKALAKEKSRGRVLLRTKSEIEGPRTVSFPSDSDSSRAIEQSCLTAEQRSNSLPSSPTKSGQEFARFHNVSGSTTQLHTPPNYSNPLIGNAVAKPYGKHLAEDSSQASKFKPFVSTLTRIHENIPSTNKYLPSNDNKTPTSAYGSRTPTTTPMGSQASLSSTSSLTTPTKSTPLIWVGDNDRIRQLQIVSTRAKKFESPNVDSDSKKTAFYRFELSRLSQRANAFNVADRKKEFERRESNSALPREEPGLSFEFGTSFNNSQRQKRWKNNNDSTRANSHSGGLMKSLSDGGSVFSVSKEYLSLPEESCSATSLSTDPSLLQGSGNRTIPVGGTKIHCEPPEYQKYKHQLGSRPLNDTGILSVERDRSNSTCSQTTKFAPLSNESSRRKSSPLIRQHSFHSIQAHLALTDVPESDLSEASPPPQPICEEGAAWPHSKHRRPAAPLPIQRPTFLDIKKHARPMADGSGGPPLSTEPPHNQGAVTSLQHRIGASGDALHSLGSHPSSPPSATGVTRRNKHLYGDENDRLVRRVSYLKATSGDRVYSDSDIDSEDEKQVAPSSASIARRALGSQGDLPSPASFQSSITTSGPLNVKLAKIHGKRAGDRSWKSVWAVVRGRALLLYKDKQQTMQTPLAPEDQVTLRGTDVAVALDYTKRRHVLRLSTPVASQFLLQAESDPAMTAWLTSLSAAAAEDGDSIGKHGAPIAEPELLSPDFESSLAGSAATTPTTTPSQLGGINTELSLHSSDANASPPSALKNAKKNSSQHKPKGSFTDQPSATKSRKITGESWSSPKSKTWKGKLGRQLRKMQAGSSVSSPSTALPEGASIGVCLEDCPLSPENEFVPVLVSLCVSVVESKGLRSQGIYRVPGNRAAVTFLTEVVNRGANAIDLTDTRWSDVNVISSLLKLFFRKLPDPLITSELYPLFIEASKIDNPQQRLTELKHLVQELPDHHYETLRFLCYHLNNIIAHSADNKMDVRNLAIVFGPTLVRASDDNMAKMVTDMSHQCQIVETLLSQVNWFFSEEESDDPPPIIPVSVNLLSSSIVTDTSLNTSELDPSSQSLLLSNVEKLEANHKDTKKLIVSSIISAANRRVQKVRKKVEEECSAISNNEIQHHSTNDHFRDYCDSSSLNQQKLSENSSRTNQSHHGFERLSGSNRDGRLFSDIADTSFPSDERLSSLSSLSSLNTLPPLNDRSVNPAAVGCEGVLTTSTHGGVNSYNNGGMVFTSSGNNNSSLSRSEPTHLGDETPIKSYAGLSASTQERIRRFETETKAMLQRDMTRHRRELDKQKLEEELQKAKKDMETEDIFDRMADNPSEVMHIMNDYRRKPSREVVSHPSLRSSASSNIKPCGLTNVSPAPTSAMTNSPFKVANLSSKRAKPTNHSFVDKMHDFKFSNSVGSRGIQIQNKIDQPAFETLSTSYSNNSSGYGSSLMMPPTFCGSTDLATAFQSQPSHLSNHPIDPDDSNNSQKLISSISTPSLFPPESSASSTFLPIAELNKSSFSKIHKKTSKNNVISRSKSAREIILRHILPFHLHHHHHHQSPRLLRRGSSAESIPSAETIASSSASNEKPDPRFSSNSSFYQPFPTPYNPNHLVSSVVATNTGEVNLDLDSLSRDKDMDVSSSLCQEDSDITLMNDKFSHEEQNANQQHPHNEGSDLMTAITATFEEKMRLLNKSHLLASEREELSRIRDRNSSPEDIYRYGKDGSRLSSSGNGGTKCKLYRDPSLHRRRTTQCSSLISHSASSEALSNPYFEYGSENIDDGFVQPVSPYGNEELDCNFKEKNEKRTLESLRVETPEGLREKKPKELKRSDTYDRMENSNDDISLFVPSDIPFSNRREKRDNVKNSAELKSRRHNVRELKEKFEQNSKKTHTVTSSVHTTSHPSGYEKSAKKQSRKSRIKRRHTVGGMKDLARVAWLKVIEAAHYGDPQNLKQGCQMSTGPNQLPSWEQLQLFLEALAEGRKLNLDQQTINSWVVREKLENSNQDLESILSLVLPPQQKETLKRRLSVREPTMKPLCPVLESNV